MLSMFIRFCLALAGLHYVTIVSASGQSGFAAVMLIVLLGLVFLIPSR